MIVWLSNKQHWLNRMSQEWKDKHIQAYVNLGGVFGGTPLMLRSIVSGYNIGMSFVDPLATRAFAR